MMEHFIRMLFIPELKVKLSW